MAVHEGKFVAARRKLFQCWGRGQNRMWCSILDFSIMKWRVLVDS